MPYHQLLSFLSDWRLTFCFVITTLINILMGIAITLRIAGVETDRIAVSFSLFNLLALTARLANLLQSPVLGSLVDIASSTNNIPKLSFQLHLIIIAATLGNVIAVLLFNTSQEIFKNMILLFERTRSMPKMLMQAIFTRRGWRGIIRSLRAPKIWLYKEDLKALMKPFVIYNALVTAFWTTGVLSAMLASALEPKYARTAILLSGVVNGIATVLFTLAVDPQVAHITDQIVIGERPKSHIYVLATLIGIGNIIGTILSHLILYPGAVLIKGIASTIGSM